MGKYQITFINPFYVLPDFRIFPEITGAFTKMQESAELITSTGLVSLIFWPSSYSVLEANGALPNKHSATHFTYNDLNVNSISEKLNS